MLQDYAANLLEYQRLPTRAVMVGDVQIGGGAPICIQTMTTTDTMDTAGTIAQTIRCIEAGAQLVRITAPSKKEAENLKPIRDGLRAQGYTTPLVADIHFTPNAAEIAAGLVEKVRINPGNYIDKKKFETIIYSDADYQEELNRIEKRFVPLLNICKQHDTAMRIGTNHGSLSDRIMSRYGDTPIGMVESAMEFLRIARAYDYHQIVLSMKSSNPLVMVEAYRLLVRTMQQELGECYPLHLGVTEAGDGEDGRIKSAVGIGTLLEDGLGDTIRVSLTEEPEAELPVCQALVSRYPNATVPSQPLAENTAAPMLSPIATHIVANIGTGHVPVVVTDLSRIAEIKAEDLAVAGYRYSTDLDKWHIGDLASDYIYSAAPKFDFELPGTLRVLTNTANAESADSNQYSPIMELSEYLQNKYRHQVANFVMIDAAEMLNNELAEMLRNDNTVVLCLSSAATNAMQELRAFYQNLAQQKITCPTIIIVDATKSGIEDQLTEWAVTAGALFLDGYGDGLSLGFSEEAYNAYNQSKPANTAENLVTTTAFGVLQATRKRITKTEYISCPSCGRTLFDLQETTSMIRAQTHHLKGVKIAIMGCIVNGPGEMADADFGYVGSGVGRITLYRGQEVVKRNVPSEIAVKELIDLMKEAGAWVEAVA